MMVSKAGAAEILGGEAEVAHFEDDKGSCDILYMTK
jgi:hypothetical protein